MNGLIENAVDLLRGDLRQKRVLVRFSRNDALPAVLGDPVQLQQVVLNLLINAGDAMATGEDNVREISIEADQPGSGRLAFSITDSGIGVKDAAQLEVMFEHFVSTKAQGLGMGLTISRSIVEAHGGRIWATANPDRGLTLHVELPTVAEARTPVSTVERAV